MVEATVISLVDYGAFVRIRDGIEALIASSDVVEPEGKKVKVGDVVKFTGSSRALKPTDGIGVWVFDFAGWKAQSARA